MAVELPSLTRPKDTRSNSSNAVRDDVNGHSERSVAESRNPDALPLRFATRSLDFARDDEVRALAHTNVLPVISRP
jgi:hypothetical protein